MGLYNWSSLATTKYASALARLTIESMRTVLVWAISIFIGWEEFRYLQLIGFLISILGVAIYNEILILKCWGLAESVYAYREYIIEIKGLNIKPLEEEISTIFT